MQRNEQELTNLRSLRDAFDKVCKEAGIHQGLGPSMAYFQTPGKSPKRYVYLSFGMTGPKPEGIAMETCKDPGEVLRCSVETFRNWLTPNRTLVWRQEPEIDVSDDGRWASHWRCVQLDDNARQIDITWQF